MAGAADRGVTARVADRVGDGGVVWRLQGAHLFVAAAVLAWRRRGYSERLQPGHCFAFQGAVYWLISAVTWVIISTVIDDSLGGYVIYSLPHGLAALAFFVWFL